MFSFLDHYGKEKSRCIPDPVPPFFSFHSGSEPKNLSSDSGLDSDPEWAWCGKLLRFRIWPDPESRMRIGRKLRSLLPYLGSLHCQNVHHAIFSLSLSLSSLLAAGTSLSGDRSVVEFNDRGFSFNSTSHTHCTLPPFKDSVRGRSGFG